MQQKNEAFKNIWPKIVAKAWSDSSFKQKLLSDPTSVLAEYGVEISSGTMVEIHENNESTIHLTLPQKPAGELSETKLQAIAGGLNTGGATNCD